MSLPQSLDPDTRVYLEPATEPGGAWTLHWRQGAARASRGEIVHWAARQPDAVAARVARLVAGIERKPPPPLGLPQDRPLLMGVVNATPDSFSGDGLAGGGSYDPARAIEHGLRLISEGADILDVGGESTRPGASPVPPQEERRRVEPVIRALAGAGHRVSIDTRNASTMQAALDAGASMVNDVSALAHDPASLDLVRARAVPVLLMHMQGEPATMNRAPSYDRPALDVFDGLEARLRRCTEAGVLADRLLVDPGLGFGKRTAENLEVLKHLGLYRALGQPLVLGASRKGLTGAINRAWPAKERVPASIVAAIHALDRGASVLRVHDVSATRQAVMLWSALKETP